MRYLWLCFIFGLFVSITTFAQVPALANKTDKNGHRQGKWSMYFDKNWKPVSSKDSAEYYRIEEYKDGKPQGNSKDYFKDGKLQWEGMIVQDNPQILDGLAIEYEANGNVKDYLFYTDNRRTPKKEGEAYAALLDKVRKETPQNTDYQVKILFAMGDKFDRAREIRKSISCFAEARRLQEKIDKNSLYVQIARELGDEYLVNVQFDSARIWLQEAIDVCKVKPGTETGLYASALNYMGGLNIWMGLYDQAEACYSEALAIRGRLFGKETFAYSQSLFELGSIAVAVGDYTKGENLFKETLRIRKKVLGVNHTDYGTVLSRLGGLSFSAGNYKKTELYLNESKQVIENRLGNQHPYYGTIMQNLGVLYDKIGQSKRAEEHYLIAEKILEKSGTDSPDYLIIRQNRAWLYNEMGQYSRSEVLYKEVLDRRKVKFGIHHHDYVTSLNGMARLYDNMGRDEEALTMYRDAAAEKHELTGNFNERYSNFLFDRKLFAAADSAYIRTSAIWLNKIQNYFPNMSEQQREAYYNNRVAAFFDNYNSFAAAYYPKRNGISGEMYDLQLSTKALLLNNSAKWKQRIRQSSDVKLFNLYVEWENISRQLSKADADKKPANEIAELKAKAEDLEKTLTKRSELFTKAVDKRKYTWKDVAAELKKGEAAIEIIRFRKRGIEKIVTDSSDVKMTRYKKYGKTDTVQYVALILLPGSANPKMILLANGNDLEGKFLKNYQNSVQSQTEDKISYNQFWGPIAKELKGVHKIYLSGDGVFHRININALKNPMTKQHVLDEIKIIFVTNTKDIIQRQPDVGENKYALLVGMPNFKLTAEQQKKNAIANSQLQTSGLSLAVRSLDDLSDLPGTKEEVEKISDLLKSKGWQTDVYLKDNALEENIKDAFKPSLLHIATHGYFKQDNDKVQTIDAEDNPLLKSGLIFSGAGRPLNDEDASNTKTEEDGILTAYEVMNLNLDNTEVVVLSACETGLGEVRNGEGVYGLQRAFKLAGAKSIIMSLWKVNDQTTQELMVDFYAQWLAGSSKTEAFATAQKNLRKKYKEPFFWAAFVMIGE